MNFRNWLIKEGKDIFGFESDLKTIQAKREPKGPIDPINSEIILKELAKHPIGNKEPSWDWEDIVKWGQSTGALKIDVSPLGSYKIIARKQINNAEGNSTWVCKRIIPFNETGFDKNEYQLAQDIFDELNKIDQELIDVANRKYPEFGRLVHDILDEVRRNMPQVMFLTGVKKLNENYYIIYNEYRGQGLAAPGQNRCEQFHVHISFNEKTGLVRCWGNEIQSSMGERQWRSTPSEWDEVFAPSQPRKEIAKAIGAALSTY